MRFVGVIALLALALVFCRAIVEAEERRIRAADAMLSLLRKMKTMILCFRMPLHEIYLSIRDSELEEIGLLSHLRECGSLREALRRVGGSLALSADLRERLAELGDAVGRGDREAAAELCEYYIGELSREVAELRVELPKRTRLHRSLVVTGMLMLVIVFI